MTAEVAGYASPPDQLARMAQLRRGVRKGIKIRRVLERELGPAPWPDIRGLDFGCGPGTITAYLAKRAGSFVGVDIDAEAVALAQRRFRHPNLEFICHTSSRLPFDDGAFDVIIVNHVYEHVRDPAALFAEARRLLKAGGLAYVAAGGRYQLLEPHYHLPFLSWLPRRAADFYLKIFGRSEGYDVNLVSYRRLLKMLAAFDVTEYTARVVAAPQDFGAGDVVPAGRLTRRLAATALRLLPALAPTRLFVLRRREDGHD
jgi:SAM-dependent methyltransferase